MTGLGVLIAAGDVAIALWRVVGVALLHGTVLAAATWLLIRALGGRARPTLVAALWALVLVKFVVPVGPAMPLSLNGIIAAIAGSSDDAAVAAPVLHTAAPTVTARAADASVSVAGLLALAGLVAWAAVAATIIARRIGAQRRLAAEAAALPNADATTLAAVATAAALVGVRRQPAVHLDDGISPWIVGIHAPILVVPASLRARPTDLAAALAHELAHLRRRDAWLRVAQVAIGALLFFWPVVRLVNRRIDAARELACDEYAIAHGPLSAGDYARMLVRLVRDRASAPGLALAGAPGLRERVDAIVAGSRRRGRPGLGRVGAAGIALWAVLSLGGAPRAGAAPDPTRVCQFSPAIAESLLASFPEADVDGDGSLSRAEVCEFQLERKRAVVDEMWAVGPGLIGVDADPGADLDGDGQLSEAEAAAWRVALADALPADALADDLGALAGPLTSVCCNCGDSEGTSSAPAGGRLGRLEANACLQDLD